MPAKGYRFNRPSKLAKLKRAAVVKARSDYAAGKIDQPRLAVRLGVSQAAISLLLQEKTYRWALKTEAA